MAENSKIEWCHHTFNPWIGCQKVSPGCDLCYAETLMDTRYGRVQWGPKGKRVRTSEANWRKPFAWDRRAAETGEQVRVFCASLADVFDNKVPAAWRADLFDLIRVTQNLTWLLLTKRPQNIEKMLPADWGTGWRNVWLGISAEDTEYYQQRMKHLSRIRCALRFVSYEPALGPLRIDWVPSPRIANPDWVICGGETGHGARELDADTARVTRDICARMGVPFFMKQMAHRKPIPADLLVREFPRAA